MAEYTELHRYLFGVLDTRGFVRARPLPAGVLTDRDGSVRRVEQGQHDVAIGVELGLRANSYLADAIRCDVCGDTDAWCPEARGRWADAFGEEEA